MPDDVVASPVNENSEPETMDDTVPSDGGSDEDHDSLDENGDDSSSSSSSNSSDTDGDTVTDSDTDTESESDTDSDSGTATHEDSDGQVARPTLQRIVQLGTAHAPAAAPEQKHRIRKIQCGTERWRLFGSRRVTRDTYTAPMRLRNRVVFPIEFPEGVYIDERGKLDTEYVKLHGLDTLNLQRLTAGSSEDDADDDGDDEYGGDDGDDGDEVSFDSHEQDWERTVRRHERKHEREYVPSKSDTDASDTEDESEDEDDEMVMTWTGLYRQYRRHVSRVADSSKKRKLSSTKHVDTGFMTTGVKRCLEDLDRAPSKAARECLMVSPAFREVYVNEYLQNEKEQALQSLNALPQRMHRAQIHAFSSWMEEQVRHWSTARSTYLADCHKTQDEVWSLFVDQTLKPQITCQLRIVQGARTVLCDVNIDQRRVTCKLTPRVFTDFKDLFHYFIEHV